MSIPAALSELGSSFCQPEDSELSNNALLTQRNTYKEELRRLVKSCGEFENKKQALDEWAKENASPVVYILLNQVDYVPSHDPGDIKSRSQSAELPVHLL